jgi:hypothetical protein
MVVRRPCTPGDGITVLSETEQAACLDAFDRAVSAGRVVKFVPASGTGSRMFQRLFTVKNRFSPATRDTLEALAAQGDEDARYGLHFLTRLPRFPFYEPLRRALGEETVGDALISGRYDGILEQILTETGFNYPNLPKGLLPFHRYPGGVRTPFEEHLAETAAYARDGSGVARAHFTVSPEHLAAVKEHIETVQDRYTAPDTRLDITFSIQKPGTDTIAVNLDNQPFRNGDGSLEFRAGGHGALLENLNDLQGDMVFIKNIDNVVPDRLKAPVYHYKRVLGGYLVLLQQKIFDYAARIASGAADLSEAFAFCRHTLCIDPPAALTVDSFERQRAYLIRILNRPVRVCGMVRNTGEPGGGPFWVEAADGTVAPQIVESAQIDMNDDGQRAAVHASTHFNPVDLVCGLRDRHGRSFDLREFSNPDAGFITLKSKDGRPLKAMEHPGLWNGGMADWNTVLIEVPQSTFHPVKTIDDLLRAEHQPAG